MALTTSRRGVGSQLPTSAVLEATRLTARNLLVWQEHWQSYCPGLTRRVEDVKRNRRVHRTAGDHSATSIRMGILQRGLGSSTGWFWVVHPQQAVFITTGSELSSRGAYSPWAYSPPVLSVESSSPSL